eukprot:TRINITY_DN44509_c0_g1_i3.p2 TRINITY_DN44509_c0_g1~~TRINITY_DN44509_c0_g1_i3.p2  ORF type:complete len:128 (+),score=15.13 TRINITY_DN44509_c0_g1_i3:595-978(+)
MRTKLLPGFVSVEPPLVSEPDCSPLLTIVRHARRVLRNKLLHPVPDPVPVERRNIIPDDASVGVDIPRVRLIRRLKRLNICLLYTSDAADEEDSVDLGGRRIIKKKKISKNVNNGGYVRDLISIYCS